MTKNSENGAVRFKTLKVYGSIAAAAKNDKSDSPLRLWWLARSMDGDGSGVVTRAELMQQAERYIGGSDRNMRRLLKTCDVKGWLTEMQRHSGEWVYLYGSLEHVAQSLNVIKITQPAMVEMREMRAIGKWRVACWDACLGGRDGKRSKPISRKALETETGVDKRAQQRYERESRRVKAQRNIAIQNMPSIHIEGFREFEVDRLREQEGRSAFPVADGVGYQLPNSYDVDIELVSRGMSRKVSKRLHSRSVAQKDATDSRSKEKVFYNDDKKAERAMRQEVHPDEVYSKQRKPSKTGAGVWKVVK